MTDTQPKPDFMDLLSKCPYCGSENIFATSSDQYDLKEYRDHMICESCDHEWIEQYNFTRRIYPPYED